MKDRAGRCTLMSMRFCMLASGSAGNSALISLDGFGLLIDAGLGPRQLAARLASVGATWRDVNALLLTHTHSDHWRDRTLVQLKNHRIPLYCHPEHHPILQTHSAGFRHLVQADLVRSYERNRDLVLGDCIRCRPIEVQHDSAPTFGFRLDVASGLFGESWSVGYLADLGCWSEEQAEIMADVDLLALEFNHDEQMERRSSRPIELIDRVMSDTGHLSNDQAAAFLHNILARSGPNAPAHVVQLHLSRECNRAELAQVAAKVAISKTVRSIALHTATQDRAGPILTLDSGRPRIQRRPHSEPRATHTARVQPSLPGLE
jgi:ribonuclease BN (tRNA processing enzyme)